MRSSPAGQRAWRRRCRAAGRRACGRWRRRRTARGPAGGRPSPMRRRRSGSSTSRRSAAASASSVVDRHEQPGRRRRGRSRGSRRRRWRPAAARPRPPRTAPSAGSRPASAGRTRRPRWYSSISSGLFGLSPWWTRDAVLLGHVVARDEVELDRPRRRRAGGAPRRGARAALARRGRRRRTGPGRGPSSRSVVGRRRPYGRPTVVVDARRDHDDLLGRHLVAVDETLLRPLRPRDDRLGPREARPLACHFNRSTRAPPVAWP